MEENTNKPEKKKLTLKDLASPTDGVETKKEAPKVTDTSDLKPIDINTIAPPKPKFNPEDTPVVKAYKELDEALERKKKETKERIDKARKEIIEARVEQSLAEEKVTTKEVENSGSINDEDPLDSLMSDLEEPEVASNVTQAMNLNPAEVSTKKEETPSKAELLKQQEEMFNESDSEESFLDEEDDDEDDDILEEESEEDKRKELEEQRKLREAAAKEYQTKVKEILSPSSRNGKVFDLSKFKIRRKPVTYSKMLAERAITEGPKPKEHVSTWILPNSGRTVTLTEFKGTDLEALSTDDNALNALQRLTRFYSTIYKHVVDPNKPETLEAWLKTVSLLDVSHLNFCVYKASFEETNYVTEFCPNKKCLNMDLVKHPIMDMVKFKDEETKKKYMDIFNKTENTTPSSLEETPVQINDNYVFGLRFPSIYHGMFESTQISRNVAVKHQALLANMAFINSIYVISEATQELIPIDFKPNATNFKTTVENKFKVIVRILKEFTPDEFAYLQRSIVDLSNAQFESPGDITYVYPESKCAKCGTTIPETEQDNPIAMVFTRLQLTQGLS